MQLVSNIQNLLKLAISLPLFHLFGASVATITAGFVLSFALAYLVSFPAMRRNAAGLPSAGWMPEPALLREVVPFGIMMTALGSFWVIIASTDKVLLGYLMPPQSATETVAAYSLATTLAYVLMTFPISIEAIFLPIISRLFGKGELEEVRQVTQTAQRWTLLITIPVSIVMMLFAADMLAIFYGEQYRAAAAAMAITTLGLLIRACSWMLSLALAAMRKVGLELGITLAVAVVNVLLNALLIPLYGMEGSAAATLAGFALMLALLAYYSRKLFGFTFPPETYKLALAGAVAFLIVFALRQPLSALQGSLPDFGAGEAEAYSSKVLYLAYLGFLITLSVALFALASLFLKCLHGEDVSLMRKAMARAGVPEQAIALAGKIADYGVRKQ